MFNDPVFFLCPKILGANKQILNSHITRCPKITVFKNPQGGGFSYLAHGLRVSTHNFRPIQTKKRPFSICFFHKNYTTLK